MATVWRSGLVYEPTGDFAGIGRPDRGVAAAFQPGEIENFLTVDDVDRIERGDAPWPVVRRAAAVRLVMVRDRGFSTEGRTIMALLVAGHGPRRRTIGIDQFELALVEAATDAEIRLDDLLRDALARQPRTPSEVATGLRRIAATGALMAIWPYDN